MILRVAVFLIYGIYNLTLTRWAIGDALFGGNGWAESVPETYAEVELLP